jgi:hypothetical protein
MSGLRRSRSGTRGVRRVVRTQIGAALEALGERGLSSDETLHDTRKRLKRVRAGLRLLREAMCEGVTGVRTLSCVTRPGRSLSCVTQRFCSMPSTGSRKGSATRPCEVISAPYARD